RERERECAPALSRRERERECAPALSRRERERGSKRRAEQDWAGHIFQHLRLPMLRRRSAEARRAYAISTF
ncbi:MAG: hypothetical protein WCJ18_04235, partial [Planctomycetota bacterium]